MYIRGVMGLAAAHGMMPVAAVSMCSHNLKPQRTHLLHRYGTSLSRSTARNLQLHAPRYVMHPPLHSTTQKKCIARTPFASRVRQLAVTW